MVNNKIQPNKADQKLMDESKQSNKMAFERELQAINKSSKLDKANLDRIVENKQADRPDISRLLDTPADKLNIGLLAKLTSSVASSNINLDAQNMAAKVASEMGLDLDLLLNVKTSAEDLVVMNKPVTKTEQDDVKKSQSQKDGKKEGKDLSTSRDTVSVVKEYTASYASSIINASGEIKRKMERLEDELSEKGIKSKDISKIQGSVKKSLSNDLSKVVKEAYLKRILSKGKSLDGIMAAKNLNDALGLAEENESIAGDVGGAKGLSKSMLKAARAEAKDFVLEELETKLMEKILSGNSKDLDKQIKPLVGLGFKLGINMFQFMMRWKEKKMHLGLFYLDPKLAAELGMGSGKEEQREDSYDMEKDEEKEILMNRLRALYMRRALRNDILTKLDTAFKMRKTKNGLIKLGLTIDDFKRINKEGVSVARNKLLEMLKESLAERSTLYDLAGPAFKLIEKQIKGVMSNLQRIGEALSVAEFENVRDTANRKMYEMAIQELHAVDSSLKEKSSSAMEKKRGKLIKLITRLKEESKIEGMDLGLRGQELLRHGKEGMRVIHESA